MTEVGPCSRRANWRAFPCRTPIATPLPKRTIVAATNSGASTRIASCGGPCATYASATGVVAEKAPAGTAQFQQNRWDQGDADEDVQRHERVHAEQNRRQLDRDGNEQQHPDRSGQSLVAVRVRPHPHAEPHSRG